MALAWVASEYGEKRAEQIANGMEYTRQKNSSVDAFADLYPYNATSPDRPAHSATPSSLPRRHNLTRA